MFRAHKKCYESTWRRYFGKRERHIKLKRIFQRKIKIQGFIDRIVVFLSKESVYGTV